MSAKALKVTGSLGLGEKYIYPLYISCGMEKDGGEDIFDRRVSRRKAVSTAVAAGAVVGVGIIAGVGGYLAGSATGGVRTETKTVTAGAQTVTTTVTMPTTITAGLAGEFGKGYKFVYITHGGEENVFWNSVNLGMTEAATLTGASAVMYRPKREGDLAQEVANFESAIALKPDGIVVPIAYTELLPLVKKASDEGIPVLVANIDAPDPRERIKAGGLAYIGQSLRQAGYYLAENLSKYFPSGSHALILMEGPGQVWAEERAAGIIQFLKEYNCTYERLDVSFEPAVVESRTSAYLQAKPETKAVFSVGYMAYVAGNILQKMGKKPGEVAVGSFDLVPPVIDGIKSGYVTITIDQQPYLQGFLPIVQLVLMKKYALGSWDVNTGNAIVDKSNVTKVEQLSKRGYR
jgi:simple sugar transport system substrate-binding protein